VKEIADRVSSRDRLLTIELSHFSRRWLIDYLQSQDQKMIRFFREKNILDQEASAV
jgi:hemerythrin